MTANHIMIDCETLGTTPGSAILSIGAVRFDPHAPDDPRQGLDPGFLGQPYPTASTFYARIDRASCAALGLTEDKDTLAWWARQTPEARHEAFDAFPRRHIPEVLGELAEWITFHPHPFVRDTYVWSHGASFDIVLLEAAYRRMGYVAPWRFWNIRDTRTLYDLADIRPERDARTHHHALHDAAAQAEAVVRAYVKLGPPRRD